MRTSGSLTSRSLIALSVYVLSALPASGQDSIEWMTLGSDYAHTRSTAAAQITAENFADLSVVWEWDGASFEAQSGRSTPSYINGRLYTVAGARRHVVAIDPESAPQSGPTGNRTRSVGSTRCGLTTARG